MVMGHWFQQSNYSLVIVLDSFHQLSVPLPCIHGLALSVKSSLVYKFSIIPHGVAAGAARQRREADTFQVIN